MSSHTDAQRRLAGKVIRAAEAALAHHHYVSAIDVFTGIGLLVPEDLRNWRAGRIGCLERVIRCNLSKISRAAAVFRRWARDRGLKPSETVYRHRSHHLRFSVSGNPAIEKAYRTHYVAPALAERKRQKRAEAAARAEQQSVPLDRREHTGDLIADRKQALG